MLLAPTLPLMSRMAESASARSGVLSRPRMQAFVLLGSLAVGLYVCYRLVQPFLPALAWGLALAVVGYPVHKVVRRRLPYPTLAAALTVLIIAVVVIAPIVFVTHQLVRQARETIGALQHTATTGGWREALESQPRLAAVVSWIESEIPLDQMLPRLGEYLQQWGPAVVMGSLAAVIQLLITVLVLFYFFRDKRDLTADVRSVLPLSERETDTVI